MNSDLVRVFFRIFQASTTSTVYEPDTYEVYPQPTAANRNTTKVPLFGVDGSGNVVVVPCFAAPRVLGASLDSQTDPKNAFPITASATGAIVYAYFGCWLDINQPRTNVVPVAPITPSDLGPFASTQPVLQWIGSSHHCLVSEILVRTMTLYRWADARLVGQARPAQPRHRSVGDPGAQPRAGFRRPSTSARARWGFPPTRARMN